MTPKFLVVDDDADIRNLLKLMLQSLGCDVELADSGPAAREIIRDATKVHSYDAILLDVMMPEVNGLELLQELKGNADTRKIPVVMITAKDRANEIIEGYQYGAEYYITKPFTKEQLVYGLDLLFGEDGEGEDKRTPIYTVPDH